MQRYVIYLRVSTDGQGRSGLGLEAQERDIDLFLSTYAGQHEVLGRFVEIRSGGDNDRPELAAALDLVKANPGSELLVAKLDRLSRKVAFIASAVADPKIRLRVATMPQADKFLIHVYAALAEQERDFISARTRAALASAKARGRKLGGMREGAARRNAERRQGAVERAEGVLPLVRSLRDEGLSLQAIADRLTAQGIPTPSGGTWRHPQIARILARAPS